MTLSSWSVGLNDTVILGGRRTNAAPRVATWDVRYAAELCQASWGTRDRAPPSRIPPPPTPVDDTELKEIIKTRIITDNAVDKKLVPPPPVKLH